MASRSFSQFAVLGLYTETALHCGAESGAGYVDLPVQRERHTHYPVIQGSTIKGVLRDECKSEDGRPAGRSSLSKEQLDRVFGTEDAQGPGSVSFGDGILVAFPVRSSGAPFHWVTCPFVLERVLRLTGDHRKVQEPGQGTAWAKTDGDVLLEEIAVSAKARGQDYFSKEGVLGQLLRLLPGEDRGFGHTRELFPERLLIVSDADFGQLVELGTEVITRIKLNALGTTTNVPADQAKELGLSPWQSQGNLFVEEVVPPESLFLCPVRAANEPADLKQVLESLPVIRLGGDETIGRGVTHLTYLAQSRNGGG